MSSEAPAEAKIVVVEQAPAETKQADEKESKKKGPAPLEAYMQHRMKVWDEAAERRKAEQGAVEPKPITITMPDGKTHEGQAFVTSPLDIAKKISKSLVEKSLVAKVNGALWDMARPLVEDSTLEFLDFESKEGKYVFWHSSAHILGQAIEKEFKEAKLCIGPPIDDGGFYYDVYMGKEKKVVPADYKAIEKTVAYVQKQRQPFQRLELTKQEALQMFEDNQFKVQIIQSKVPDGERCTAYRCGPLIDLCRGPHLPNTGVVKAMCVTKNSAAYWLGKAENESLQRVYGISFPTKDELAEYKDLMKKAEERDHRRIGTQQKLFFFHPLSPGSAFFLPHGTRVYNKLIDFIRTEYRLRGYNEVITPNVFHTDLWKTSGHYANYKENMFLLMSEEQEFGMKPMNCPAHCVMFDHTLRSYRELPLRLADFGVLHRNEFSGALSGLTRVRRFQQDDAHIFCRQDQIEQEVGGVLDMLRKVYGIFGFRFDLNLSTRPEKFLGEEKEWDQAEQALTDCLNNFGHPWAIKAGDGAFYGPKIDIQLYDALKRQHQCATIQLDFQLPQRFELQYKNEQDKMSRPVIVHRAILGSVERMFAVLVEHTGGKWPFWLNPRQIQIVPVANTFNAYAQKVHDGLFAAGYHVDVDLSHDQFNKKIRTAQLEQYSFILVVGEKETNDGTVTVRVRDDPKQQSTMPVQQFMEMCAKMTAEHK